nr:hypothetical protein CFP56_01139 [Quercus suber]
MESAPTVGDNTYLLLSRAPSCPGADLEEPGLHERRVNDFQTQLRDFVRAAQGCRKPLFILHPSRFLLRSNVRHCGLLVQSGTNIPAGNQTTAHEWLVRSTR